MHIKIKKHKLESKSPKLAMTTLLLSMLIIF